MSKLLLIIICTIGLSGCQYYKSYDFEEDCEHAICLYMYEALTDDSYGALTCIVRYLDIDIGPAEIAEIDAKFSKANVQAGGIGFSFQEPGHITNA